VFIDIVGSTAIAARVGDRQWRETVQRYHDAVRRATLAHAGVVIKTTGDGAMATFEQPTNAVRAAEQVRGEIKALDLRARAGVHMGECEITGDDVHGLAVNIAARIADKAGADEILVSHTVRDLVLGSDMEFTDRGVHPLKGVPGRWRLFSVPDMAEP
jgi:class 3 adenylate cyclase